MNDAEGLPTLELSSIDDDFDETVQERLEKEEKFAKDIASWKTRVCTNQAFVPPEPGKPSH